MKDGDVDGCVRPHFCRLLLFDRPGISVLTSQLQAAFPRLAL